MRTASAVVMIAVAGSALWLGGYWWTAFVAAVALGVYGEWVILVLAFARRASSRLVWLICGVGYVGVASVVLMALRSEAFGLIPILTVLFAVVATDVGAYFAGRTFGGPKIAPRISPSKTWSGLGGGMVGATLVILALMVWDRLPHTPAHPSSYGLAVGPSPTLWLKAFVFGPLIAVTAQGGDFFESWMKRRAGAKDSGKLIPGHGGLFDRADGLLAVLFVAGICIVLYGLAA